MKSITVTALGIAFKIWIIAVLINTIADTLFINGLYSDFLFIALIITMYGGLFSIPVLLILWCIIYNLLQAGRPAGYILKFTLLTGVGLAVATWVIFALLFQFFEADMIRLALAAPLSGAIAICISYPNIKKAANAMDANKVSTETFDAN